MIDKGYAGETLMKTTSWTFLRQNLPMLSIQYGTRQYHSLPRTVNLSMTSFRKHPMNAIYKGCMEFHRNSTSILDIFRKMFAIRRTIVASGPSSIRQLSTSRILLAANASPLESALRDGLKTAMKSKDRPAATCIKVSFEVSSVMKAKT